MTNEQKYKTTDERMRAFWRFCKGQEKKNGCLGCPTKGVPPYREKCALTWLALEAEEELLSCPFCGGNAESQFVPSFRNSYFVRCKICLSSIRGYDTKDKAIAAWNRRAK